MIQTCYVKIDRKLFRNLKVIVNATILNRLRNEKYRIFDGKLFRCGRMIETLELKIISRNFVLV